VEFGTVKEVDEFKVFWGWITFQLWALKHLRTASDGRV
jgi:hypothetical protein